MKADDMALEELEALFRPPWPEPQPLPLALPPVEPFAPELLPEAFRPWIEDVAERIQCPPDFPAVAAMIALAVVVGRQVGIRPKRRDDWLVVANLWGAVVGRPGVMKSPALQEPLRPLYRLEAHARAEHEEAIALWRASQVVATERKKVAAEGIRKALKAGKPVDHLAREATAEAEGEPRRRRYITSDATVEKLGELLRDNPRGILIFRDELTGFLRSLDREGREGARAFFLEAWNGNGRFTFDRIGRGVVEIEAACVSLLGGIQPGPLGEYICGTFKGAGDDGLLQRFQLLTWPDVGGGWRDVDCWPNGEARHTAYAVFERLDRLSPGAIGACQDDEGGIPYLHFTPEAQALFSEWRSPLEARLRGDAEHPSLEAHLAKYRSLIPSLALLIGLADSPEAGAVGEDALLRACAWGEYLESHARRLYAPALMPDIAAAVELDRHIRRGELPSSFAARDVYRRCWRGLDLDNTVRAATVLVELDRLAVERIDETGGRPRELYRVNPRLQEEGRP